MHQGWNKIESALKSQGDLPQGWGIGIAHAYSGTMALDIDSWSDASSILMLSGIDLQALYDAQDAVIIDSGRQGHGKLLYRVPMPLPSKKLETILPDGKKYNYLDFRCATQNALTVQDVLPPSIHPDTKQPYRWAGRGHWTRLPMIPDALLALWQGLLAQEPRGTDTPRSSESVDWDIITSAVNAISPDVAREQWVQVGMALQYAGSLTRQDEGAFILWNKWSAGSTTKYPGERDLRIQWRSFRTDKGITVTTGTLFHLANEYGWKPPTPDASGLFPAIGDVVQPRVLITSLTPSPPDIDMALVPEVLARAAQEVSDGVGCDPLVPLMAGLAAVCGAADARTRLELMPGFKVPPVLWLMTIGEPADKKTPGSSPMFDILRQIEREDVPRYSKEYIDYEVRQAMYESGKKNLIDWSKTADAMLNNTAMPVVPPEPEIPVAVKVVVQDITSQKLVRHCADRPRGMLCYLDEMAAWAEKITDPRSGEDRSAWTVAYESRWYEMDRVGAGTISADNFALSIYGNVQPRVLMKCGPMLSNDGMLQRFIPVTLRSEYTRLGNPVPDYMSMRSQYEQMVRVVYGLPSMTYRLHPDAYAVYREFQEWYEQTKRDERITGAGDTYMTAFGKLEGLVGRVTLVWHMIEAPYETQVSRTLMERVIRFVRGFVVPSLRYVHGNMSSSFDKWMVDWVMFHCDKPTVTMGEIRSGAKVQLADYSLSSQSQKIIGAMSVLQEAGWVVRLDDGSLEHRNIAQWAMNPELQKVFIDRRKEVIAAKQRLKDQFYQWTDIPAPKVKGHHLITGT
jgi:hypothetical protein